MAFGNRRAREKTKRSWQVNFQRKFQKRVDVAQKMAPGCPKLGLKGAKMTVIWGGPGAYDGHRREKTNRRENNPPNFRQKWVSCVDVAQK